jgi:hypothetical protein
VQWVFVNLPMPSHLNAWVAAEAALCAGAVAGRFWPMHDRLFESGRGVEQRRQRARPLSSRATPARPACHMDAWQQCVERRPRRALILQDVIFGSRVTGTPTFIVNNQQTVVGVKTFAEWREILDGLLRRRE